MQRWQRQPYARVRQRGSVSQYKELRVINPSRGLNLLIADILSNDKEATLGTKNIEYIEGGVPSKRMGYAVEGTGLDNPPKGLAAYVTASDRYMITSDGGTLKKYDGTTWTALSGAVTLSAVSNITMTSIFEKTYAWDGQAGGIVYDGTSVTRPGTMPKAKWSVIYKGYHVAGGVDGQPFRLYFSPIAEPSRFVRSSADADPLTIDLNNATDVPGATVFTGDDTAQAIDINKNDGQKVVGVGFFQDVLIVFKEKSIYQLYFNTSGSFVVERISSSYGAVCHGAIQSVENDCYFLTDKGIYVLGNEPNYYASIRTNELSSRIKTLLQRINHEQWDKCRAVYYDDRYFLTVPLDASTDCNAMIVYDRRFYSWQYWTNINAESLLDFKDITTNETNLFFTEYGANDVCKFTPGIYNDKGEAIEAVFVTRAFEGKEVDKEKRWYKLRPIFRRSTGSVQIDFITENGSFGRPVAVAPVLAGGLGVDEVGALLFGTSLVDEYTEVDLGVSSSSEEDSTTSSETDRTHTVYDIGVGIDSRTLKVKFSNDGLNETFALLGWVLVYEEKDPERFDGAYTIR